MILRNLAQAIRTLRSNIHSAAIAQGKANCGKLSKKTAASVPNTTAVNRGNPQRRMNAAGPRSSGISPRWRTRCITRCSSLCRQKEPLDFEAQK